MNYFLISNQLDFKFLSFLNDIESEENNRPIEIIENNSETVKKGHINYVIEPRIEKEFEINNLKTVKIVFYDPNNFRFIKDIHQTKNQEKIILIATILTKMILIKIKMQGKEILLKILNKKVYT